MIKPVEYSVYTKTEELTAMLKVLIQQKRTISCKDSASKYSISEIQSTTEENIQ